MTPRPISPEGAQLADKIMADFFEVHDEFVPCREDFEAAYHTLAESFRNEGTLFICGSGGSYADSLHIAGELMKRFECRRPIPEEHRAALEKDPDGKPLASTLEAGLRAIALGSNGALASAILNDQKVPDLHFAQELYVLGHPGDVVMGISTSGNSEGVLRAFAVARIMDIRTIALTGPEGGKAAQRADVAIRMPGKHTYLAQQSHLACYHALCRAVESAFFPTLTEPPF